MSYFKDLNQNINIILTMLLNNQLLCKYLYYGGEIPAGKPDIDNTSTLLMSNIFPLPLSPNAESYKKAILNVYFPKSKPYAKNSGFREILLCFDVMVNLDVWMLNNNEILPYSIISEIDKMFNNKQISDLSMNKIYWEDDSIMKFSDYYYGFRLTYRLSSDSNVGCLK